MACSDGNPFEGRPLWARPESVTNHLQQQAQRERRENAQLARDSIEYGSVSVGADTAAVMGQQQAKLNARFNSIDELSHHITQAIDYHNALRKRLQYVMPTGLVSVGIALGGALSGNWYVSVSGAAVVFSCYVYGQWCVSSLRRKARAIARKESASTIR